MKINLGLHLDGAHSRFADATLGVTTVGPAGLLNLLETQLGLLHATASQSERVVQFRECLKLALSLDRFYAKSFQTDELGTAATLLAWRDEWHSHGWAGDLSLAESQRLRDMQAVEAFTAGRLAWCEGERLQRVLDKMAQRSPAIDSIVLLDPLANFPARWQAVLARLPLETPTELPLADGLLGRLQSALKALNLNQIPEKLTWVDDGSVRFVQSETKSLAAHWLAGELPQFKGNALIVAEQHRGELDGVLASANLPRQGFKEPSAFRPTLQVLPLALDQLWSPLDVGGLLQFLTHPVCPVLSVVKTRVASKIADVPGLGAGEAWDKALESIKEACEKYDIDFADAENSLNTWVLHERYSRLDPDGVPLPVVVERVSLLLEFFRSRLAHENLAERVAFNAAFAQTQTTLNAIKALQAQGETCIRARQLQKLVAQATAQGSTNPLNVAQVGACAAVTQCGAAVEPVDHVLWWQLSSPALPKPYPWSKQEMLDLQQAGVTLPSMDSCLAAIASEWLKPILAAQKSLTLMLPTPGTEPHPLWQMVESLFGGHPPVVSLESVVTQALGNHSAKLPIENRPLPARARWWHLPENVTIPQREKESFSSLESYLFNPYQWLLRYPAKLKSSDILEVSDSFLLFGTLSHTLAERLFGEFDGLRMSQAAFEAWFPEQFAALIRAEGAVLEMPGRGTELETFRQQLKRALETLREQLVSAGVVEVCPEVELEGRFKGGEIGGFADLVVKRADGEVAIVDLKWAGGKKYPQKLEQNSHLQLAIYAELLRQKTGNLPHVAYFILSSQQLIANDDHFFPKARVIHRHKSVQAENLRHLWNRFEHSWAWRREQMRQGEVELILSEEDIKDGQTEWPEEGLKPEALNQSYNEVRLLAGWGEDQ